MKSLSHYWNIAANSIGELLLDYVINNCFKYRIFPEQLKCTVIRPIDKKGDRTYFDNYRPIALIYNISKTNFNYYCAIEYKCDDKISVILKDFPH